MGEHSGVTGKTPHLLARVHFHRWGKWSPWFQRHNLVWQSARSCRKCGKVQTRQLWSWASITSVL
jgi:hypothetical protein